MARTAGVYVRFVRFLVFRYQGCHKSDAASERVTPERFRGLSGEAADEAAGLLGSFKTLQMATASATGEPYAIGGERTTRTHRFHRRRACITVGGDGMCEDSLGCLRCRASRGAEAGGAAFMRSLST